jgi:hypothetical protein
VVEIMRSAIFALTDPVAYCILNRALPNNGIKFFGRETLNPTSFPGWPSFGDLLCHGGSRTIVGMTFHIHRQSYLAAKATIERLSPAIAELRDVGVACSPGIYEDYPNSLWLEIKWSSVAPNRMIDIQSCNILWYCNANHRDHNTPIAFGIEDLEYLAKEADYDLIVPSHFPFPHLALEFLND